MPKSNDRRAIFHDALSKIEFDPDNSSLEKFLTNLSDQISNFKKQCDFAIAGSSLPSTKMHLKEMSKFAGSVASNLYTSKTTISKKPIPNDVASSTFTNFNNLGSAISKSKKSKTSHLLSDKSIRSDFERLSTQLQTCKYLFLALNNEYNGNILSKKLDEILENGGTDSAGKNYKFADRLSFYNIVVSTEFNKKEKLSIFSTMALNIGDAKTITNYIKSSSQYKDLSSICTDLNSKMKEIAGKNGPKDSTLPNRSSESDDNNTKQKAFFSKLDNINLPNIDILKTGLDPLYNNISTALIQLEDLCSETIKNVRGKITIKSLNSILENTKATRKTLETLYSDAKQSSVYDGSNFYNASDNIYNLYLALTNASDANFHDPFNASTLNYPETREKFKSLASLLGRYRNRLCMIIFENECTVILEKIKALQGKGLFDDVEPFETTLYYPKKVSWGLCKEKFSLEPNEKGAFKIIAKINHFKKLISSCCYGKTEELSRILGELDSITGTIDKTEYHKVKCAMCGKQFDHNQLRKPSGNSGCNHFFCKNCVENAYVRYGDSGRNYSQMRCPICYKKVRSYYFTWKDDILSKFDS